MLLKAIIKRLYLVIALGLMTLSGASFANTVVLVPGYFSAYVPGSPGSGWHKPYFSSEIINVFAKAGYNVYIADNLNPVGTIEQNGELLIAYLNSVQKAVGVNEPLHIVAHSAGGLYTIYAYDKVQFPIVQMITISTPFAGVQFVDRLSQDVPGFAEIAKFINLASVVQFKAANVAAFTSGITTAPRFPIVAYTGYQAAGLNPFNAGNLSGVFVLTDALMNDGSDGIVTNQSAWAAQRLFATAVAETDDYIHLDHWKQNTDADYFALAGMTNLDYIRQEQIRFYTVVTKHMVP